MSVVSRRCRWLAVSFSLSLATVGWAGGSVPELGSRRELFVDHFLIERLKGASLAFETPRDEGIALRLDRPWEGPFCGYATVLRDGPRFRLYYRGLPEARKDGSDAEVTCVADSIDGIRWAKPELGLFEVGGGKSNNVILAG